MGNKWIKQFAIILFVLLILYFLFYTTQALESDFERAVEFVLKWEGGYVKDDPGGETNFGISKNSYPELDISSLTVEQVKPIYYQDYWLKAGCDELNQPLDIIVFDTAVNMGVSKAKEFLEESSDWKDYLFLRIEFYTESSKSNVYLRGWINRVVDLYKEGK